MDLQMKASRFRWHYIGQHQLSNTPKPQDMLEKWFLSTLQEDSDVEKIM